MSDTRVLMSTTWGELFHTVSPDLIIRFIQRAGLFYVI